VKSSCHWKYSEREVGYPRRLNLPDPVKMWTRNNSALPATVVSAPAVTVELSYYEICGLQRHQYLGRGKWKMHIHSSYEYTLSRAVNDDPGIVRMVSNLMKYQALW
jgi:hypothetical protein